MAKPSKSKQTSASSPAASFASVGVAGAVVAVAIAWVAFSGNGGTGGKEEPPISRSSPPSTPRTIASIAATQHEFRAAAVTGDNHAQSGNHKAAVHYYGEALRLLSSMVTAEAASSSSSPSSRKMMQDIPAAFFYNAANSYAKEGQHERADTLYKQTAALLPADGAEQMSDVFGKRALLYVWLHVERILVTAVILHGYVLSSLSDILSFPFLSSSSSSTSSFSLTSNKGIRCKVMLKLQSDCGEALANTALRMQGCTIRWGPVTFRWGN